MNKLIQRFTETKIGIFQIVLTVFSLATFIIGRAFFVGTSAEVALIILAAVELLSVVVISVYIGFNGKNRRKELQEYIEALTYSSETAKNSTLLSFPMPMAVFRMSDTGIIWANDMFFAITGECAEKLDAKMTDLVDNFSSAWIAEGHTQYPGLIELNGKKYAVHGNVIRTDAEKNTDDSIMFVTYWMDVTEYDDIRIEYEETRPIAGVVVIDNYEEMTKGLPDREKNDLRDAIEDRLSAWAASCSGIVRRYDRDRYLMITEKRSLRRFKEERFPIIEEMHSVESPNGIAASISLGFGEDGETMEEAMHFSDLATELALTRGGDQAVVKNRMNFEFFGGRGGEVEKRTKVRTRVMANTLSELVKDSSSILVLGHRFADFDCVGAGAGICALARKYGIRCNIAVDETDAASPLIDFLKGIQDYRNVFISIKEAAFRIDGRTLIVVVDTNRPEQIEGSELLESCSRVAVIDHHRASASYIHNAALGFIEPSASSTCELVTEILHETVENDSVLKAEADALLSGIVLDTKNFTIRTSERTFDAASFLKSIGADTTEVKKLLQGNMEDTIRKYRILQTAELYRDIVVIASPEEPSGRIVAAKAADELLNISGVEASIVVANGENGGSFVSARSIGELNVQIIMEKIGGGGNRSAAAAQFPDKTREDVLVMVRKAVDDYLGI